MASILQRLHRGKHFESSEEWETFDRKLKELLDKGIVETIPVGMVENENNVEQWIRDRKKGDVWRLVAPDFPGRGLWEKVKDPGQRSFFRELWPHDTLDPEQYRALRAQLDQAVQGGELERAIKIETQNPGAALYHHPATGEVFELLPPKGDSLGWWQKLYPREGMPWYGSNAKPG